MSSLADDRHEEVKQLNREEKAQVIADVVERLERTGTVVAADFRGLSVAALADLRGKLREADAEMTVVKNTLSKRAADQVGRDALVPYLTGPTGLVWVNGDPAAAAKVLSDFAKAHDVFSVRGGILDGEDLPEGSIKALAALPSRDVLLARLAGGIAAPLTGLAGGLQALITTMARTLAAVQTSGQLAAGEAPASEAPAEAAAAADAPAEEPAAEAEPPAEEPAAEAEAPADEPAAEAEAPTEEPAAEAETPATSDDAAPAGDGETETPEAETE